MDIFETCKSINDSISAKNESQARNDLIMLLDYLSRENNEYSPLVNHLIRQTGLYPYINTATATWQDRYIYEIFKVDIGQKERVTLHREQSLLLKKLVEGKSLAISAPTSFGKSFVIDAFIAINKPTNVVIIVPTIALTDETRRRLYSKFAHEYRIITTTEEELSKRNIFIFPQERAISYADRINDLDILVIDEFYKASSNFDKERSPALLRAILKFGNKAKQRYFLAPNISSLEYSIFTKGMEFIRLDFNTVFLEKHDLYLQIKRNEAKKSKALLKILKENPTKSLIYAGTYPNIDKVANLLIENTNKSENPLLQQFATWLSQNYDSNWKLTSLAKRGHGVHNGNLHRSLSQIQVRLFEDPKGLNTIISTSSIIEGVNTSAENVIIWSNKNGRSKFNNFTYKNIIGRGGRMFKHFIGKIYILEEPPCSEEIQLQLEFPNELLGGVDEVLYEDDLTAEQINRIISFKEEISEVFGPEFLNFMQTENVFQTSNMDHIKDIAFDMHKKKGEWINLLSFNPSNTGTWDRLLYKAIGFVPGGWDVQYSSFVAFIKVLSKSWVLGIPDMLSELDRHNIGIDLFFKLERNASFKMASLLNDINTLQRLIIKNNIDISPFVSRLSHAFLPPVVFHLEEYGLPRMISKRIHQSGTLNLENSDISLHEVISSFNRVGRAHIAANTKGLSRFDKYILDYFYEGITTRQY